MFLAEVIDQPWWGDLHHHGGRGPLRPLGWRRQETLKEDKGQKSTHHFKQVALFAILLIYVTVVNVKTPPQKSD